MALKESISDIKNHAMQKVIHIVESPSNYCWQEETPEGRRISDIENVIRVMRLEMDAVREKYKRKEKI